MNAESAEFANFLVRKLAAATRYTPVAPKTDVKELIVCSDERPELRERFLDLDLTENESHEEEKIPGKLKMRQSIIYVLEIAVRPSN